MSSSVQSLPPTTAPLSITVVSDVVCPWCFIGLRHLTQALALFAEQNPTACAPVVDWQPFQLNPDMPLAGMDRDEYVRRKFGDQHDAIMARMAEAGQRAGIDFAFERITRQPNTLGLHALIACAQSAEQQGAIVQALFDGYFLQAVDMTDLAQVSALMVPVGLDAAVVADCLELGGERQQAAAAQDAQWRAMQVQGVPLFVFNQRWAVSGAQPPEVLAQAMAKAMAQEAA
jgi:predicted DsbA family dithiol-disulfide isomerase